MKGPRANQCRLSQPDRIAVMRLVSSLAYRPGLLIQGIWQTERPAWRYPVGRRA